MTFRTAPPPLAPRPGGACPGAVQPEAAGHPPPGAGGSYSLRDQQRDFLMVSIDSAEAHRRRAGDGDRPLLSLRDDARSSRAGTSTGTPWPPGLPSRRHRRAPRSRSPRRLAPFFDNLRRCPLLPVLGYVPAAEFSLGWGRCPTGGRSRWPCASSGGASSPPMGSCSPQCSAPSRSSAGAFSSACPGPLFLGAVLLLIAKRFSAPHELRRGLPAPQVTPRRPAGCAGIGGGTRSPSQAANRAGVESEPATQAPARRAPLPDGRP